VEVEQALEFLTHHRLNAPVYEDLHAALANTCADYVVLMTPREIHECAIHACVKRGVPIWMEAPPCRSMSEGAKISTMLESSQLCHSVGFLHRYNEALNAARQMIGYEPILTVHVSVQSKMDEDSDAFGHPSLAVHKVNVLSGQALHYVDLCRYVVGGEIMRIIGATGSRQPDLCGQLTPEVDTAAWVLQMGSNTIVTHSHSCRAPRWSAVVEIVTQHSHVRVNLLENSATGIVSGRDWTFKGNQCELEAAHRAFLNTVLGGRRSQILSTYSDAMESFRDVGYISSIIYGHCHDLD
jgi:predicted dehydrogenase